MNNRWFVIFCVLILGAGMASAADMATMAGEELLPPNAKPGECYARVWVPPTYTTKSEEVLKKEASERVEIVPASFESGEETVLVKEASKRLEVVPASYEWVEERVMVRPASKRLQKVPATYETVTEQVVDTPAHTVWKKGKGLIQKVDNTTGEIMCLVEVPATYKTVSKRVLVSGPTVEEVTIPAEYTTVKKRVMKNAPSVREIEIPAEYKTIKVTKQVTPPEVRKTTIPAEYQTVTSRVKVSEGRMAWQTVLCETNVNRNTIVALQRSLQGAGYDPGKIDGVVGSETLGAVTAYQRAKGLATGGLTLETLRSLGVL